jgi:hypothetical protein
MELQKLHIDTALSWRKLREDPEEHQALLERRGATQAYNNTVRRLETSEIVLTELDIEVVNEKLPPAPGRRGH